MTHLPSAPHTAGLRNNTLSINLVFFFYLHISIFFLFSLVLLLFFTFGVTCTFGISFLISFQPDHNFSLVFHQLYRLVSSSLLGLYLFFLFSWTVNIYLSCILVQTYCVLLLQADSKVWRADVSSAFQPYFQLTFRKSKRAHRHFFFSYFPKMLLKRGDRLSKRALYHRLCKRALYS